MFIESCAPVAQWFLSMPAKSEVTKSIPIGGHPVMVWMTNRPDLIRSARNVLE